MDPKRSSARAARRSIAVGVAVFSAAALSGCAAPSAASSLRGPDSPSALAGVENVKQVSQLTGPDSPNRTDRYEIAGQDLGSMFQADGKTWFLFGDSFGQRDAGALGGVGTEWRSNALAYSSDTDPRDGIKLDGYVVDDIGWAKELLPAKRVDGVEMTIIPTYGFAANGAMYIDYMSVRHWGDPGEWETNYAGLAKSIDHGKSWAPVTGPKWGGDSGFVQVSVTEIDGDLYFWGVTHGRFGPVRLMRVPERDVEKRSAYRYFAGTDSSGKPRWSSQESDAAVVADGTVGELSVVWSSYLDRWLMTYTDGGGDRSAIRDAPHPWGPWSDPTTLVSGTDVPGQYAPFMAPQFTADGGRTIYFTLSKWDPYNVFWYRADLVKRAK